MAIVWTGPYSNAEIPAGQRVAGWCEYTTGAGTLKTRYRDGDPVSSFVGRELVGNVNYHIAQSRRMVWYDSFTEDGSAAGVPSDRENTGTDWTARAAIYTLSGPHILAPNTRRGGDNPTRLVCRVSAAKGGGAAGDNYVRIYAIGAGAGNAKLLINNWTQISANVTSDNYAQFTLTSASFPGAAAAPEPDGFTAAATIVEPLWQRVVQAHPQASDMPDVELMHTWLVLAGIGNATDGPLIDAVMVYEEEVAT